MTNPYLTEKEFVNPNKNNPNWYKKNIGGMWEKIGKLQFNFLIRQGLQPKDYLLDIGCGSLRGGIHFINYLEPKHYYGIDLLQNLLDAGKNEINKNNLNNKKAVLKQMEFFEFKILKQKFDFAIAQSLFTHLPLNDIIHCLINVEKVLIKKGKFYATFFENKKNKFYLKPISHFYQNRKKDKFLTFLNKDPFHYHFETFGLSKVNGWFLELCSCGFR
ncbi:class I SAM-dependent methyltransferase, partial [Patescibacteria group bacterium]|nr:class I SAM-dependent methyltransferase [Patescibacteria group bacterium]